MLQRRVMFRIEPDKFKKLEALAGNEHRTVSNLIRLLVDKFLKEKTKKQGERK